MIAVSQQPEMNLLAYSEVEIVAPGWSSILALAPTSSALAMEDGKSWLSANMALDFLL